MSLLPARPAEPPHHAPRGPSAQHTTSVVPRLMPRAAPRPLPPAAPHLVSPAAPRLVLLPALLLATALLLAGLPFAPAHADGARWRWPVPAPHTVLAPFEQPEHRYGPGHRGIDIAVAAEDATVRAVEGGTVRFSGEVAGRGVVSVRHADGLLSTYEPVLGVLEAGSPVRTGEVLGTLELGSTASHCPGALCLHLGARRGEGYLDPLLLLSARGPSVLLPWDEGAVSSVAGPSTATGSSSSAAGPSSVAGSSTPGRVAGASHPAAVSRPDAASPSAGRVPEGTRAGPLRRSPL